MTFYKFGNPCLLSSGFTLIRNDGQWVVYKTKQEAIEFGNKAAWASGCKGVEIWSNRSKKLVHKF